MAGAPLAVTDWHTEHNEHYRPGFSPKPTHYNRVATKYPPWWYSAGTGQMFGFCNSDINWFNWKLLRNFLDFCVNLKFHDCTSHIWAELLALALSHYLTFSFSSKFGKINSNLNTMDVSVMIETTKTKTETQRKLQLREVYTQGATRTHS